MNATTAIPVRVPTSNWKRAGWVLLLLGGLFAAGNALMFMLTDGHGSAEIKDRFFATALAGWGHALGGVVAALIGPFQLITTLRTSWPRVHVWMGRMYLLAVLAGGLSGLYFAPMSSAMPIGSVGFGALAVFWLYTGAQAYISIRKGNVQAHRRWMLRNYALTFGAATLRIELPLLIIFGGLSFTAAYTLVAWLSWVPNWLVVEWWVLRRRAVAG